MTDRQPFDRGFNVAVQHIANKLFPTGFDVGPDAPDTYESLIESVRRTGRLKVFDGGSDRTIFADAEVNYAFRAWHDWCHYHHNLPFSKAGEYAVCDIQIAHIRKLFGDSPQTRRWSLILEAEIIAQANYLDSNGEFVADQYAFTSNYVAKHTAFGVYCPRAGA